MHARVALPCAHRNEAISACLGCGVLQRTYGLRESHGRAGRGACACVSVAVACRRQVRRRFDAWAWACDLRRRGRFGVPAFAADRIRSRVPAGPAGAGAAHRTSDASIRRRKAIPQIRIRAARRGVQTSKAAKIERRKTNRAPGAALAGRRRGSARGSRRAARGRHVGGRVARGRSRCAAECGPAHVYTINAENDIVGSPRLSDRSTRR